MEGQLIEVKMENHDNCIAKIKKVNEKTFSIKYLQNTEKYIGDHEIFKYDDYISVIEKECVDCYFETDDEEDIGYKYIEDVGFVFCDDDDYIPEEED